jgi:NADH dehydrogenase
LGAVKKHNHWGGNMSEKRIVVIGGGHAGLNAVKEIEKQIVAPSGGKYRVLLIDKQPYHLRKVLLFRAAVSDQPLKVPFSRYFGKHVEVVQASLRAIDSGRRMVQVAYPDGSQGEIQYDRLVLALGSTIREAAPEQGGISLKDLQSARKIRSTILENISRARNESDEMRRRQLLTVAVAGAGITGIETSAEIGFWLKEEAKKAGIDPDLAEVTLCNAGQRLLEELPEKVGKRLEEGLRLNNVKVRHNAKAEKFAEETVYLQDGSTLQAGLCIWTLGLQANPLVSQLGLPVEDDGKLSVDPWYHVKGFSDIYAIGDCAKAVDPATGKADGMTCKEAIPQAQRVSKIIKAELAGKTGPQHKGYPVSLFCIGLGPGNGLLWVNKWGIDLIMSGKLAGKIKGFTWDIASMIDRKIVAELNLETLHQQS